MDEQLSSTSAWRTVAAAYDELAGEPTHRALAGHACSCGLEFEDTAGLSKHLADESAD